VKPFALAHAAEFRPQGPPLMNSMRHADYIKNAEEVLAASASLDGSFSPRKRVLEF
jgi:hypothetical protein